MDLIAAAAPIDLGHVLSTLPLAVVVFVSTNVDDILLLAAFFSDQRLRPRQIIAGQLLGMTALVAASAAGALLAFAVPEGWIGLLGVAPLLLGLQRLWALRRSSGEGAAGEEGAAPEEPSARLSRAGALAVAAVTVANGGDNLGVYIPLFSSAPKLVPVYAAVFMVMTGVWCALGYYLVNNRLLGARIRRYGQRALPFVLIGLGLWLLSHAVVLVATSKGAPMAGAPLA
jgi:cadmium resistance protein CadD (predicted permease)